MLGRTVRGVRSVRAVHGLAAAADHEAAFVKKSIALYKEAQATVDAAVEKKFSSSKMVLFMEGTPDAPRSERSMNVIKMLTSVQAGAFTAVDTTAHPAILGYTAARTGKGVGPHLYVDGSFAGDHDALLRKFQIGALANSVNGSDVRSSGTFANELPIGTY